MGDQRVTWRKLVHSRLFTAKIKWRPPGPHRTDFSIFIPNLKRLEDTLRQLIAMSDHLGTQQKLNQSKHSKINKTPRKSFFYSWDGPLLKAAGVYHSLFILILRTSRPCLQGYSSTHRGCNPKYPLIFGHL